MPDPTPQDRAAWRRSLREHANDFAWIRANRPQLDKIMSCPCGRGDYDLCPGCPYDFCSVHGKSGNGDDENA